MIILPVMMIFNIDRTTGEKITSIRRRNEETRRILTLRKMMTTLKRWRILRMRTTVRTRTFLKLRTKVKMKGVQESAKLKPGSAEQGRLIN